MIKKCDHPGCTKAGLCRAPKKRDSKDYYWFCRDHAAEYNKNWNYYEGMTPEELNDEWEREVFGISDKDLKKGAKNNQDYVKFIHDILYGRSTSDKNAPKKKFISSEISLAFALFELPITSSWNEVSRKYRILAKKHHPDTAKNKETATQEFSKLTNAYETLKKYFQK